MVRDSHRCFLFLYFYFFFVCGFLFFIVVFLVYADDTGVMIGGVFLTFEIPCFVSCGLTFVFFASPALFFRLVIWFWFWSSSFSPVIVSFAFPNFKQTPRAQRTSTDAQTWEFSHLKFLRGRPDLLDEIKRKALEPDPTVKQRVDLPGELVVQLNQMREESAQWARMVEEERGRVSSLVAVVKTLCDVMGKMWPGHGEWFFCFLFCFGDEVLS